MNSQRFKAKVLYQASYQCEVPNCDADADTVHHFFPRSTFPKYKTDLDNGMACCGACHAEIERRIRKRDHSELQMYPYERYVFMKTKLAVKAVLPSVLSKNS